MAALSMISGRSGKLGGSSGKHQPAISRRTTSALPTTMKYLAMGTADSSRELRNRGRPMDAMLHHTHVARQIDQERHAAATSIDCGRRPLDERKSSLSIPQTTPPRPWKMARVE